MPSNYAGFPVQYSTTPGSVLSVGAGVSVKVRADGAGSDAAESPLTTNSDGEIVGGSLAAIAVGTLVHFRVENYGGKSASFSQITT
jgi:hypothetical protein